MAITRLPDSSNFFSSELCFDGSSHRRCFDNRGWGTVESLSNKSDLARTRPLAKCPSAERRVYGTLLDEQELFGVDQSPDDVAITGRAAGFDFGLSDAVFGTGGFARQD